MADPKRQYKVGGKVFDELEDGTLREVVKEVSIADAPRTTFKPPSIPLRIPGKAVIEAEKAPITEVGGAGIGATPGMPLAGLALDSFTPEGKRNAIRGTVAMGAGMVGGPAGFLGSVARSAGGTIIGDLLGQAVGPADAEDTGVMSALGAGLEDAAISSVFGGLGAIAGAARPLISNVRRRVRTYGPVKGVKEALTAAILNSKYFVARDSAGNIIDPMRKADRVALNATKVPLTLGIVTGQELPEQVLVPQLKANARRLGEEAALDSVAALTPSTTKAEAGRAGLDNVVRVKELWKSKEDAAYQKLFDIVNSNTKKVLPDIPPVYGTSPDGLPVLLSPGKPAETMAGPVNLGEVNTFAKETMQEIDNALGLVGNSPTLGAKLTKLQRDLSAFSEKGVAPFAEVREAQASINKILRDRDNGLLNDNTTRILTNLKKQIDIDVLASMEMGQGWPEGSVQAYKAAMNATKKRTEVITKGVNKAFQSGEEVPEKLWNDAFNSATEAKQMARVAGRQRTSKEFLRRFMDKYWNKSEQTFAGNEALREWGNTTTSEVAKAVMTSAERSAFEQFLRVSAKVSGDPSNIGVLALKMSEMNAGIGSAKDLVGAIGSPGKLFSSNLLKLTAYVGSEKFAEKVLLNPAKARMASRLIAMKRGRPGGESEARKFILAGNLGEVLLRAENGEEVVYDTETGEATKVN